MFLAPVYLVAGLINLFAKKNNYGIRQQQEDPDIIIRVKRDAPTLFVDDIHNEQHIINVLNGEFGRTKRDSMPKYNFDQLKMPYTNADSASNTKMFYNPYNSDVIYDNKGTTSSSPIVKRSETYSNNDPTTNGNYKGYDPFYNVRQSNYNANINSGYNANSNIPNVNVNNNYNNNPYSNVYNGNQNTANNNAYYTKNNNPTTGAYYNYNNQQYIPNYNVNNNDQNNNGYNYNSNTNELNNAYNANVKTPNYQGFNDNNYANNNAINNIYNNVIPLANNTNTNNNNGLHNNVNTNATAIYDSGKNNTTESRTEIILSGSIFRFGSSCPSGMKRIGRICMDVEDLE